MGEEQRKYIRIQLRLTTFVKFLDTGKVRRALTKDLSAAGICFVAEEPIPKGTPLGIELQLPDRQTPIQCLVEVVWCKPVSESSPGSHAPASEVGVKFVSIDPKERALILQYATMNALPPSSS